MTRGYGPFLEVARIQSEINRLFDNLLDLGDEGKDGGNWIPNADILETSDSLIVMVELPGVDVEQLSVSVHSGNIVIKGVKAAPDRTELRNPKTSERVFGSFRRAIQLGAPVNTRQAEAVLKNGLLRICFPKVPNRRGEAVAIEVRAES